MTGIFGRHIKNLVQVNSATRGPARAVLLVEENPTERSYQMPIGQGGSTSMNDKINNLIDVGGIQCDFCKKEYTKLSDVTFSLIQFAC